MKKRLDSNGKTESFILIVLGLFSFSFIILFGFIVADLFINNSSDNINKTLIVEKKVTTDGGKIVVNNGSEIDGLTLEIEENSYDFDVDVSISTSDISNVEFVEDFNPITPLIIIDNLHEFSSEPMILSIPINIDTETEFAMAFFYDKETKDLEAVPTVSLSDNEIKVATSHFSNIVISTITLEKLIRIGLDVEGADSLFTPGIDDWSFTNRGSYLAPGGHCAGQTVTAAYYYINHKKVRNDPNLWDRFDNNGVEKTPDFWYDDSDAYQYASVIQYNMNFGTNEFDKYLEFGRENDYNVYYSILYSIHITKNPQLMAIYSKDLAGDITGGHAILIYKVNNSKLYVADPNYPGKTDRYIEFNTFDILVDYSSGANATEIANSGVTLYSDYSYIGLSANIDFKTIDNYYYDMLEMKTFRLFDLVTINYGKFYDTTAKQMKVAKVDGPFTIAADYNDHVPDEYDNNILFVAETRRTDLVISVYRGTDLIIDPKFISTGTYIAVVLPLVEGENDIGILIEQFKNGKYYYVGFERIDFTYLGTIIDPEKEIQGKWHFDFPEDQNPLDYNTIEFFANGFYQREMYYEEGMFSGLVYLENGTYVVRDRLDGTYDVVLYHDDSNATFIISDNYTKLTHTGADWNIYIKDD